MAPATVLVVDDDPVILKLLEVNFEMEGFEVVRASDGAEGLERAREVRPDIVVLDVMMPRMTGYEVAKALREDDGTAHIPIIFVTARAQSSDVERGMELGVDDYVTKPFDPLDLIARVNTLLARVDREAEPGDPPAADRGEEPPTAQPGEGPPAPHLADGLPAPQPGDGLPAPQPGESGDGLSASQSGDGLSASQSGDGLSASQSGDGLSAGPAGPGLGADPASTP